MEGSSNPWVCVGWDEMIPPPPFSRILGLHPDISIQNVLCVCVCLSWMFFGLLLLRHPFLSLSLSRFSPFAHPSLSLSLSSGWATNQYLLLCALVSARGRRRRRKASLRECSRLVFRIYRSAPEFLLLFLSPHPLALSLIHI